MDNVNGANSHEVGIGEGERGRIFVTMNATFRDEAKCRVAMETIVKDAHAAYGVTSHFWFRSEDGKSLFVVEQYADRAALRQAVRRFTSARMSFFRSIKVADVSLYGDASRGVKATFLLLRPTFMNYRGGFSKTVAEAEQAGIKDVERKRVFVATNAIIRDEVKSKETMRELVNAAYAEPATHSHFWADSRDGQSLFVLEQYADEQALVDHLVANPRSQAALGDSMEVESVTVYGVESERVKEVLAPLNPTHMTYYGGYSK